MNHKTRYYKSRALQNLVLNRKISQYNKQKQCKFYYAIQTQYDIKKLKKRATVPVSRYRKQNGCLDAKWRFSPAWDRWRRGPSPEFLSRTKTSNGGSAITTSRT